MREFMKEISKLRRLLESDSKYNTKAQIQISIALYHIKNAVDILESDMPVQPVYEDINGIWHIHSGDRRHDWIGAWLINGGAYCGSNLKAKPLGGEDDIYIEKRVPTCPDCIAKYKAQIVV